MEMQDAEEFLLDDKERNDKDDKKERPLIRTAVDLQRLKLEKLMKNPDKPVMIPETHKEKDFLQSVPTFVRNVMGSSAGAGSGEFHVYRHLRRKEYARQKYIQAKSVREQLDDDYRTKIEQNKLVADAKTAKKRAKRLKKKEKMKQRGKKPKINAEMQENVESSNESSENEGDDDRDIIEDDKDEGNPSDSTDKNNEKEISNKDGGSIQEAANIANIDITHEKAENRKGTQDFRNSSEDNATKSGNIEKETTKTEESVQEQVNIAKTESNISDEKTEGEANNKNLFKDDVVLTKEVPLNAEISIQDMT